MLHGDLGSPQFCKEYMAARFGRAASPVAVAPTGLKHDDPASLAWLINQYMSSTAWAVLKPRTQQQRRTVLARVARKNGGIPFGQLVRNHIEELQEDVGQTGATAMANRVTQVLRVFLQWATDRNFVPANVALGVKKISRKEQEKVGFHTWTLSEMLQFEQMYPLGTRERLAYEVLAWTGARLGDAITLGKQHVHDGQIVYRTTKTGEEVIIPIPPALAEALAAGPVGDLCWIVSDEGLPYTDGGFGHWFRRVCDKAGVKGSAHGLRKALAARLAEDGHSVDELKAWFGWTENRTPGVYTRKAKKAVLTGNIGRKMQARLRDAATKAA